jgi:hypothetical protein
MVSQKTDFSAYAQYENSLEQLRQIRKKKLGKTMVWKEGWRERERDN